MKCKGFLHTCKSCKKRFQSYDKSNPCECGADRRCGNEAVVGYNFCSKHGGPSPAYGYYGKGRPMTTGTGSSFPLIRLAAKYNEMKKDGRILSNRHSITIIDHRVQQLIERIDADDAPDRLNKLQKLWNEMREFEMRGNEVEANLIKKEIDIQFEQAREDYLAWEQMFNALDVRRKMIDSEVKVAKDIQAILTAEDGYELIAKITGVIIQVVNDPNQLKRIQYEITRLIGDTPIGKSESIDVEFNEVEI
jgi:hypothetical protein